MKRREKREKERCRVLVPAPRSADGHGDHKEIGEERLYLVLSLERGR